MGIKKPSGTEANLAAAAIAGATDPEADYKALLEAREKARPAGPGLKGSQLDAKLFRYSTDKSALESGVPPFREAFKSVITKYHETTPKHPGTEGDDPFAKAMFSEIAQSRPTPELQAWITENTPQNGYFTPEMVTEAVADNPNVKTSHEDKDGIRTWSFADASGERSFTLSRPLDGQRPEAETRPYLAVGYRPEYDFDTQEVVAKPRLWLNGLREGEYATLGSSLGTDIMNSLQVPTPRVHQEIDFNVVEAQAHPLLTDASGSSESFESVMGEAYVVADLHHPDQSAAA